MWRYVANELLFYRLVDISAKELFERGLGLGLEVIGGGGAFAFEDCFGVGNGHLGQDRCEDGHGLRSRVGCGGVDVLDHLGDEGLTARKFGDVLGYDQRLGGKPDARGEVVIIAVFGGEGLDARTDADIQGLFKSRGDFCLRKGGRSRRLRDQG